MGKKKGKHVLMSPLEMKWPTLDKETEDKIISSLTLKLQEFPSLESKRTKEGRKKTGGRAVSPPSPRQESTGGGTAQSQTQKAVGDRVSPGVQRCGVEPGVAGADLSGERAAPLLGQGLYMLVASRQCPALCLSSLQPWLTSALGIDNILALGFKKTEANGPNDFGDFVTMATALAPPLRLPGASPSAGESTAAGSKGESTRAGGVSTSDKAVGEEKEGGESAAETVSSDKDWQVMDPEQEKVVMDKLLELLTPYKTILQTPKSKLTPEDLQTRKSINSCIPTDLGAVRKAAESGQLELVLLQRDPGSATHPIMAAIVRATTTTTKTTKTSAEKGCAMLHLASLRSGLTGVTQGTPVRAVGFRKTQFTSTQQPDKIRQFVTMATQYSSPTQPSTSAGNPSADNSAEKQPRSSGHPETGPKRQPKFSAPVYDVSSVYVYKKKAEEKSVAETRPKNSSSAGDMYISLSLAPTTIQYLGVKPLSSNDDGDNNDNASSMPGSAFIDSRGSGIPGKSLISGKASTAREDNESTDAATSGAAAAAEFLGVMGLDVVDSAPAVSISHHEPRGKKPKANLKRALDEGSERGEFVSFKLQRTGIGLSVPNPNKKRKKKKFNKKK